MEKAEEKCKQLEKAEEKCKQLEYIGLLVFWEATDMITDWILYSDVNSIEPGIVYGPPDQSLINALLAFSVIGTLTFMAQVGMLLTFEYNMYKKNTSQSSNIRKYIYDTDLVSVLTILFEDFPQAVITLTIVCCREEGISYVQIAKAILPIIELIARITYMIFYLRSKKKDDKTKEATTNSATTNDSPEIEKIVQICMYLILTGLVVIFFLNLAMLILITTEKDVDIYGNTRSLIKLREIKHIFDEEYNDQRYLSNVGLYLHIPNFDFENSTSENWIHLTSISNIEKDNVAEFRILMDNKGKYVVKKSTCRDPFSEISECFYFKRNRKMVTPTTEDCINFSKNITTFSFRFEFKERKIPTLLLGDINYNWNSNASGICSKYLGNDTYSPVVHYYRSKPGIPTNHHLIWETNYTRFFQHDDLIDVKYFWKTSFLSCHSHGRTEPNLDTNISLNCTA